MRYKTTKSLSTLVADTLQRGPYAGRWQANRVRQAWRQVVGDERGKIVRFFVKAQKLYVKLASPVLQYELRLHHAQLLERLNAFLSKEGDTKGQLHSIIFLQ